MTLIDTHTHLFLDEFNDDRSETVQKAVAAGVEKMLLPNVDSLTINGLMDLASKFPEHCLPMMGLHPTSVKNDFETELEIIEKLLEKNKYYGIGETGIDLYWDKTFCDQQVVAFRQQINWAKKYKLPLVIHSRESFNEIFDVLEKDADSNLFGVFHSFAGTLMDARKAIAFGFKLGINGIITFKNSGLDRVIAQIDPKNLVLETDSPFLAPVPHRGKRNESSYLVNIARKLADIYGLTIEKIAELTTKNATALFKL